MTVTLPATGHAPDPTYAISGVVVAGLDSEAKAVKAIEPTGYRVLNVKRAEAPTV